MVGVIRRMNKLRLLLALRHGPGAAILPPDVTRIHLQLAMTSHGKGASQFWRKVLPSLKFWNPSIPMIVNRVRDHTKSARVTVYFREDSTETAAEPQAQEIVSANDGRSTAPPPTSNERVVVIGMKGRSWENVLKRFMEETGAQRVQPTPQEEEELRDAELAKQKAEVDRARVAKVVHAARKEEQLLRQARNEVAAMKAAA